MLSLPTTVKKAKNIALFINYYEVSYYNLLIKGTKLSKSYSLYFLDFIYLILFIITKIFFYFLLKF